jgi:hypothetical protein
MFNKIKHTILAAIAAVFMAFPATASAWTPPVYNPYPMDSGGGYGWIGPIGECVYMLGIQGGRVGLFYNQLTGEWRVMYCDYPLPPP